MNSRSRAETTGADLHGEEKILGEGPFGVDPLAIAAITGPLAHLDYFLWIVFVRAFGPNRFAFAQVEAETRFAERRGEGGPGVGFQCISTRRSDWS